MGSAGQKLWIISHWTWMGMSAHSPPYRYCPPYQYLSLLLPSPLSSLFRNAFRLVFADQQQLQLVATQWSRRTVCCTWRVCRRHASHRHASHRHASRWRGSTSPCCASVVSDGQAAGRCFEPWHQPHGTGSSARTQAVQVVQRPLDCRVFGRVSVGRLNQRSPRNRRGAA